VFLIEKRMMKGKGKRGRERSRKGKGVVLQADAEGFFAEVVSFVAFRACVSVVCWGWG
jgi:hypothetical protein